MQLVVLAKTFKTTDITQKYKIILVLFQSTSSFNISALNSFSKYDMCMWKKERVSSSNKRIWAIDMNDTRAWYLRMCNTIDIIDHFCKNTS